jgi:Domain of unknown function (DUF4301)
MRKDSLTSADIRQIENHGLTVTEVIRQMERFEMGPSYLRLHRPCTPGDGIRVLTSAEILFFERLFERAKAAHSRIKFVPASGAASRMFKVLLKFLNTGQSLNIESLARQAQSGDSDARSLLTFYENINRFAFIHDLDATVRSAGRSLENLVHDGDLEAILEFLLTDKGLAYSALPKGLLNFHSYGGGSRTPFEEHLVEAASYIADRNTICKLHFTVSKEHLQAFQSHFERVRDRYEQKNGVSYDIDYSLQKPSTDTLAVDLDNLPFRLKDGHLLFRPGGHGALVENLNDLNADMVFIKNIDNVVPDRLKGATSQWKKILGGLLIHIQDQAFRYLEILSGENPQSHLPDEAMAFAEKDLLLVPPETSKIASPEMRRKYLLNMLNRPIRVCGMVRNVGEPGGGPFWVMDKKGHHSCQIVEMAQIDLQSEEQKGIVADSTHFNPVDLVCGVRDWKGQPFDLRRFVDPEAVFISKKSKDGKNLKALELPGLWNGAMARWNTLFVEVPPITFNPVKTINDLLRKEHQA